MSSKPGVAARARRWSAQAGRRLGAFGLALLCGVAVPLSPLLGEFYVTGAIANASWSAVGITYAAGVGLVSRAPTILVVMLIAAAGMSFIYGVDVKDAYDHMQSAGGAPRHAEVLQAVKYVIAGAVMLYVSERFHKHISEGEPFLEI